MSARVRGAMKARRSLLVLIAIGLVCTVASCIAAPGFSKAAGEETLGSKELMRYPVIPRPLDIIPKEGEFVWTSDTRIVVSAGDPKARGVADHLAALVTRATGFIPVVHDDGGTPAQKSVELRIDAAQSGDEAYKLRASADGVRISARTAHGLFYGVQTLRQLLPVAIDSAQRVSNVRWTVPAVEIEDAPRFAYRGMHLDVARHFFDVDFVKRYIDWMARFRFNTFHWHLTDDQGWRIEIKQYPRLTEVGAYRKETLIGHGEKTPHAFDGTRYGGFYTQAQIRDVVRYAEERFVTVVPEIEMPGHSTAALAAYPELGCTPGPFEVATRWGVFEDVLCPKEETFTFLQNVLTEVMDLFPSPYLHIGGDEAPKARWLQSALVRELKAREGLETEHEVQSYFIQRIDKFVTSKGRRIIGWDEILEGGLSPNAVVMSWRGFEGGAEAVKQGHPAIMTPFTHTYFDQYQVRGDAEPLAIGGFNPLEKVYGFEPIPEQVSADKAHLIMGAQGNVWTEYMKTTEHIEYMIFPRMLALSEVVWSPKDARDYDSFLSRLRPNLERLESMGVRVARHGL